LPNGGKYTFNCPEDAYGPCTSSENPPYFEDRDDVPIKGVNMCESFCSQPNNPIDVIDPGGNSSTLAIVGKMNGCDGLCYPSRQLMDPAYRVKRIGDFDDPIDPYGPYKLCHPMCNCPRFNYCQGECVPENSSDGPQQGGNPPTGNRTRRYIYPGTDPFLRSLINPNYPLDSGQVIASEIESLHTIVNRKVVITLPNGTIIEQCLPILDDNAISNYPPCN
jgi:hypothetical protein